MAKAKTADASSESSGQSSKGNKGASKGGRLLQSDVPAYTLSDAMKVAEALRDDWAKKSATPLDLAASLSHTPTGTTFRMMTGSAAAYGLTEGAAQSALISLTDLGRRCVAPTVEGDDLVAMREAVLKPRVIREFLEKYDGNAMPQRQIALNVIETLGVPQAAAERAYEMILKNAEALGFLLEIKGKSYVKLSGQPAAAVQADPSLPQDTVETEQGPATLSDDAYSVGDAPPVPPSHAEASQTKRVFITHGKNVTVVEQIKKILTYGKFEPVVSAQTQTVAKPVPDKVMDDMRSCDAAIVHVAVEKVLLDETGTQYPQINPNVLIEIGAAMALYNRKFVLLVESGVKLPSNLQGLYEVRYEGEQLEFDATMKLLEVFSNF